MRYFRMKLHAKYSTTGILKGVKSVLSKCGHMETFRHRGHLIAVAHPNVHFGRQPSEQSTCRIDKFQAGVAKFAIRRRLHGAAHIESENLQAVANTEKWTL